jgi:hypothetical protein
MMARLTPIEALQKRPLSDVAQRFKWRDQHGGFTDPASMETRHLFYTLRMIWNHTMPLSARIEPFKRYKFGPFYTEEYLKGAIKHLSTELGTRRDMRPHWEYELGCMIRWLSIYQLESRHEC